MADLIDREALLEKVQYRIAPNSYDSMIIGRCVDITRKLIEDAPAVDAVEVCRCKECIYSNLCDVEWMLLGDGVENPYCAAGERRADDAEK